MAKAMTLRMLPAQTRYVHIMEADRRAGRIPDASEVITGGSKFVAHASDIAKRQGSASHKGFQDRRRPSNFRPESIVASRKCDKLERIFRLTLIITVFLPSLLRDMAALTAHQSNSTELPMR